MITIVIIITNLFFSKRISLNRKYLFLLKKKKQNIKIFKNYRDNKIITTDNKLINK